MHRINKVFKHRFFNSYLLKVFTYNGFGSLLRILSNFILVKFIALILGPQGLAFFGQLGNFTSIVNVTSSGGISNAIIKYTAENRNNYRKLFRYWYVALLISFFLFIINLLAITIFSKEISKLIFNSESFFWVIIIIGFSTVIFVYSNFVISVLNGYNNLIQVIAINVLYSVLTSVYCIIVTFMFKLNGALFSLATSQIILFFLTLKYLRKQHFKIFKLFSLKFNLALVFKEYCTYSLMAIVSVIFVPTTYLVIKSIIISKLSINDAGIYEGLLKLSNAYLGIIASSITFYYLPKLSAINSYRLINKEIKDLFILLVPCISIFLFIFFISKNIIIKMILSKEFLKINTFIIWQLIGDAFRSLSFIFSILFISKKLIFQHIFLEFLFFFIFISITYLFIDIKGLVSVSMSYMISCVAVFLSYFILHLRQKAFYE